MPKDIILFCQKDAFICIKEEEIEGSDQRNVIERLEPPELVFKKNKRYKATIDEEGHIETVNENGQKHTMLAYGHKNLEDLLWYIVNFRIIKL